MKEAVEVEGIDALFAAGHRLREVDPHRFSKLLALARAYVAIYDRPDEAEDIFLSRVAQVTGAKAMA